MPGDLFATGNRALTLEAYDALQRKWRTALFWCGGRLAAAIGGRIEMELHYPSRRSLRSIDELEHELRTPLASILSISEILRDHPNLSSDERRRFLDAMHTESGRLAELVELLLKSGRLDRAFYS